MPQRLPRDTDVRKVWWALEALARANDGTVLSDPEDVSASGVVRLECQYGHAWETTLALALAGSWCAKCRQNPRIPFEDIVNVVRERGGAVLSDKQSYKGLLSPVRVRCGVGHEWSTQASNLRRGKWCIRCAEHYSVPFSEIVKAATERGGEVLTPETEYRDTRTRVLVRCAEGHEWDVLAQDLRAGSWCRSCAGHAMISFDQLLERVRERAGVILSPAFRDGEMQRSRVRVRCASGHEWTTAARKLWLGHWCPVCAGRARYSLDEFRVLAKKRGGLCLSTRYEGIGASLTFRCAAGHEFRVTARRLRAGRWCHACAQLESYQRIVEARGGVLLTERYEGPTHPVRVRCASGHVWSATIGAIRRGTWCPQCRRSGEVPSGSLG